MANGCGNGGGGVRGVRERLLAPAWLPLNYCAATFKCLRGADHSERLSPRAKFCVPYLFSFASDSRLWGSVYGLRHCTVVRYTDSVGLLCLTSLTSQRLALPCLVELAFYICFNFLAISWTHLLCSLPPPCPSPSIPFSISHRVYWPHLSVKWRWREAR